MRPRLWSPLPSAYGAQPSVWISQVAGPSSSSAPRTKDPAGCAVVMCHRVTERRCCLRAGESRGHPEPIFSRLTSRGSLVRVPTHRRVRCRPASALSPSYPSQGSLPVFLAGFTARVSHPQDDDSVFRLLIATPFFYRPTVPGRTRRYFFTLDSIVRACPLAGVGVTNYLRCLDVAFVKPQ
jgi:hypothetical protein